MEGDRWKRDKTAGTRGSVETSFGERHGLRLGYASELGHASELSIRTWSRIGTRTRIGTQTQTQSWTDHLSQT